MFAKLKSLLQRRTNNRVKEEEICAELRCENTLFACGAHTGTAQDIPTEFTRVVFEKRSELQKIKRITIYTSLGCHSVLVAQ
jgi:hypothetical protein